MRRSGPIVVAAATAILAALLLAAPPAFAESRIVRVGVYENEPKVFTDAEGRPAGIFIDLIEAIAEDEGWTLEYVPGTWSEGLDSLAAGEIDLMPDVAYTTERDDLYDFHEQPVVESWSYVYAAPGTRIERMTQLDGMRVAVLEGSVQQTVFEQMIAGFELDVTVIPVESLASAFDLAASGEADAAIANYLFGDYSYEAYGLEKTPIVFNAIPLHFAVAEGRNADLLQAIDSHLGEWEAEPGSVYYQTLRHYTVADDRPPVSKYVFWVLGGVAGLLVLAIGAILLLRWQVSVRTRHLVAAKAELEAHRAHLEEEVRERTAQLERANRSLAEASRAKGEFAKLLSHALRAELSSMVSVSGSLIGGASGELTEEQKRRVEEIRSSGTRLMYLATSVLTLARLEAGGMRVSRSAFDARKVVKEVVAAYSGQADERGILLSAEVPRDDVMVMSDRQIVRQILMNLVDNAVKFTDAGSVTVGLFDSGSSIVLRVRDTGRGISPRDTGNLFVEFWQGDHADREEYEGAGLGLAISAKMAALIGADISVSSVPGMGSTFTLTVPAGAGTTAADQGQSS